jgi:hypothetical protein
MRLSASCSIVEMRTIQLHMQLVPELKTKIPGLVDA